MIILHAGYLEGHLVFWGEAPATAVCPPPRKGGRPPKVPRAYPSPYDAGAEALAAGLAEAGTGLALRATDSRPAVVWLPSRGDRPAACNTLVAQEAEKAAPLRLAPWLVSSYAPAVEHWLPLLCACAGKHVLAPGVVVGYDLRYWTQALRLGGALAARQQYLPDVQHRGDGYYARWRPLFVGEEAGRLSALAAAMPAPCRALGVEKQPCPEQPAAEVLGGFVGDVVDCLVRAAGRSGAEAATPAAPETARRGRRKAVAPPNLHEAWVAALQSPDGRLAGEAAALEEFLAQVRAWQRPLLTAAAAPFRLCFRLSEPPEVPEAAPRPPWEVQYLLQAQDDPSLMLDAGEAWAPEERRATALRRPGFEPRQYLLSALGQAATLSPAVESSLRHAAPEGYHCDEAGAYEFLCNSAPALQQAGFGVLLPSWWSPKGAKTRLGAKAQAIGQEFQVHGNCGLEAVVDFRWRLALGGEELSEEELNALAELKAPLVQLRGQWVHLGQDDVRTILEFIGKQKKKQATAGELVRMALGAGAGPGGLPVLGVEADGWLGELLTGLQGQTSFTQLDAPEGLRATLRPYQLRGYSWLAFLRQWGFGACLADDMGLGKTIQTLALIERDRAAGSGKPTLLACPTSVLGNWQREAERFTPDLPVLVHHGPMRHKGKRFEQAAAEHGLVLTSYALLHRDLKHLQTVDWAGVILDEAQNIKNPKTHQAKAARSLPAGYRIALTGTPVENNVGDLWSIMEFLNPGFLGSQNAFRQNFLVPIHAWQDADAAALLKRLTSPFTLRRVKTDPTIISDLPDKVEVNAYCNLTREQATLYASVTREVEGLLESLEGMERRGLVLSALSRLKQICNHPAQFLKDNSPGGASRSGKLARLTELVQEILAAGERALVFTQFTEMGELLVRHLQETFGEEVYFLHGGLLKRQRDHLVQRFQEDPQAAPLFVLSLKAGGTGLNLTRANHVIHFDRWWNPAVENQATDRAFRIGQTRNVQVHKFVCLGTIEEKIDEMISGKQAVANRVMGSGEAWLTELSTDDLRDLFALREGAVEEV